jgi:hypothetical protein
LAVAFLGTAKVTLQPIISPLPTPKVEGLQPNVLAELAKAEAGLENISSSCTIYRKVSESIFTSDSMQVQKPNKYQGSKFAEGRLKLSTACTECHKRKQKAPR